MSSHRLDRQIDQQKKSENKINIGLIGRRLMTRHITTNQNQLTVMDNGIRGGTDKNVIVLNGPKIGSEFSNMFSYLTIRYHECFVEKN